MIGSLKGLVGAVGEDWAIIDVNGVGYEVHASPKLLAALTAGEPVSLSIETVMRDDLIRLYAFADASERVCFRALKAVQGVGAKHALSVLNVMRPSELADAAVLGDWATVARAHGVGKKIAQRIVTELKSAPMQPAGGAQLRDIAARTARGDTPANDLDNSRADALSALVNLGYGEIDAARAVASARTKFDNDPPVEDWIKAALKEASAA